MTDFIEIFLSNNPRHPYYAITWRSRTVADIVQYAQLADIRTYCIRRSLPVVCKNEQIREKLRSLSIEPQHFATRMFCQDEPDTQHLVSSVA